MNLLLRGSARASLAAVLLLGACSKETLPSGGDAPTPLAPATANATMANGVYANLHTAAQPSGEIRANLTGIIVAKLKERKKG